MLPGLAIAGIGSWISAGNSSHLVTIAATSTRKSGATWKAEPPGKRSYLDWWLSYFRVYYIEKGVPIITSLVRRIGDTSIGVSTQMNPATS